VIPGSGDAKTSPSTVLITVLQLQAIEPQVHQNFGCNFKNLQMQSVICLCVYMCVWNRFMLPALLHDGQLLWPMSFASFQLPVASQQSINKFA